MNKIDNNSYFIESFTVNTHNIFGTVMIAVYAPYLLPELISSVVGMSLGC